MNRCQKNIAFGVLAGGKSSRMGREKATMPFRGATLLEAVLFAGREFPERLVSLSAASDPGLARGLSAAGITIVSDEREDLGPLEGIRQILLHARCSACLITATDMPFLTPDFLACLAKQYRGRGNLALTYKGMAEPLCSIYTAECLPAIEELLEKGPLKPSLLFERVQTRFLPLEETGFPESMVCNINSAGQYEEWIANYERKE